MLHVWSPCICEWTDVVVHISYTGTVHAHAHNTIYAKVYAYVHVAVHVKACAWACVWAKRMCPAVTVFGMEKGDSDTACMMLL